MHSCNKQQTRSHATKNVFIKNHNDLEALNCCCRNENTDTISVYILVCLIILCLCIIFANSSQEFIQILWSDVETTDWIFPLRKRFITRADSIFITPLNCVNMELYELFRTLFSSVTCLVEAENFFVGVVVLQRLHTDSFDWLRVISTSSYRRKREKRWQNSIICNLVLLDDGDTDGRDCVFYGGVIHRHS